MTEKTAPVDLLNLTAEIVASHVSHNAVAMDDFIYGEPLAVPEPAGGVLMLMAGVALLLRRR